MLFGTPTTIDILLTAIETQLISELDLNPNVVFSTVLNDRDLLESLPVSDLFLPIRFRSARVRSRDVAGGGRELPSFDGIIDVLMAVRVWSDKPGRADNWLKDSSRGALQLWGKVFSALEQFCPATGSYCLLIEPMRNVDWSISQQQIKTGWGLLTSAWEVNFVQDLG